MTNKKLVSPINKGMADVYRSSIERIRGNAQRYSLVDYPAHNNIGDSAIWVGEKEALTEIFGKGPDYVASHQDYRDDIEKFCKDGVVFIHGGGNFGDLWLNHHEFRLRIIKNYPHRRIVQLPQSIHFSGPEHIEKTKSVIGEHKDFHLYVRDQASFDFATKELDCPVYLAPDAAHCIRTYISETSKHKIFSLVRTDKESLIPDLYDLLSSYGPISDWKNIDEYFYKNENMLDGFFRRRIQYKFSSSKLMMRYRSRIYNRKAEEAVANGTRLLSQGKLVISDRLHAHIICCLMGKRHISIDNANGKVREYIRKWGNFGITELVDSKASLLAKIEEIQKASPQ